MLIIKIDNIDSKLDQLSDEAKKQLMQHAKTELSESKLLWLTSMR